VIIDVKIPTSIEALAREAYGYRVATNLLEKAAKAIRYLRRW
jgi:hypothetical protein